MHKHATKVNGGTPWYWLLQCVGWGGYCLLYYLAVLVPFHATGWPNAVADAVYGVTGLASTHLLRGVIRRRHWPQLQPHRLFPRLAAAAVVVGLALTAALEGSFVALGLTRALPVLGAATASIAFFSVVLAAIWLAIYWLVLGARRRRAAETQALQAEILAREAQLGRLQAQLNPHFLFNCLNSLRALIAEDPRRAQTIVTRLSELLRYALRADRVTAVPLAEEWAAVEDYLALEGVRLEERLRVTHALAPAALRATLPPMLLQGLVENAVKLGIAPRPEGGTIHLSAAIVDHRLQIEVRNTGGPRPPRAAEPASGLGLANARQRLRLLYGETARLELEEAPPGATRAVLVLPFQPMGEAACLP